MGGVLPEYLTDPSFGPALRAYARAEAVCELLTEYLADQSMADATKGQMSLLEQLRRWTSSAQSLRRSLGLDPMARAALTKDLVTARATVRVRRSDRR